MSDQIIDNGHKTSYIMSLVTALFYKSSNIINILNKDPYNKKFIYIQEFIREHFTDPLQRGFSINKKTINEFRNYMFSCGWKDDIDDILEEHDVCELFQFIIDHIYDDYLMSFSINNDKDSDIRIFDDVAPSVLMVDISSDKPVNTSQSLSKTTQIAEIKTNIVRLTIPDGMDKANLTDLFKMWINRNVTMHKYRYKMNKYFTLLPLFIERPHDRKVKIDIMYKIKYFNISDNEQDKLIWYVHSIICHSNDGYYTILRCGKDWIKISDKDIPSFNSVDMSDKEQCQKISEESIIIFYRSYDNII